MELVMMFVILLPRRLRVLGMPLAVASGFVIGGAVMPAYLAQAGSEHPMQQVFAFPEETEASAEDRSMALEEGEPNENAAADISGVDELPLSIGRVVNINETDGTITIEHRPIERFYMEAMTMIFHIKDRTLLAGLTAGDKIRFKFGRAADGFVVTRLEHSN